ncbi:condensation protein, partial [Streptomyces sp. KR55]
MTAVEHPAHPAHPTRPPVRIPFPVVDEVARHCLQDEEPETVHIEVHLPGPLDPPRLRKAFTEALQRHPRILMREAPGRWYRRRYEWELTAEPDVEVVSFPPPTRDALRDARTRTLSEAPPLSVSPPIRLEVVTTAAASSHAARATPAHTAAAAGSRAAGAARVGDGGPPARAKPRVGEAPHNAGQRTHPTGTTPGPQPPPTRTVLFLTIN